MKVQDELEMCQLDPTSAIDSEKLPLLQDEVPPIGDIYEEPINLDSPIDQGVEEEHGAGDAGVEDVGAGDAAAEVTVEEEVHAEVPVSDKTKKGKREKVVSRRDKEKDVIEVSGRAAAKFFVSAETASKYTRSLPPLPPALREVCETGVPSMGQLFTFYGHLMTVMAQSGPSPSQVEHMNSKVQDLEKCLKDKDARISALGKDKAVLAKEKADLAKEKADLAKEKAELVKAKETVEERNKVLEERTKTLGEDVRRLIDGHAEDVKKLKEEEAKNIQEALNKYVCSTRQFVRMDYFADYRFSLLDLKYRKALLEAGFTFEMNYSERAGFPALPPPYVPAPLDAFSDDTTETLESFVPSQYHKAGAVVDAFKGKVPSGTKGLIAATMELRRARKKLELERQQMAESRKRKAAEELQHQSKASKTFEAELAATCAPPASTPKSAPAAEVLKSPPSTHQSKRSSASAQDTRKAGDFSEKDKRSNQPPRSRGSGGGRGDPKSSQPRHR